MAQQINIDGVLYDADALPPQVKNTLGLMQLAQQRQQQAQANLQIETAAVHRLGEMLRAQLEDVDPVAPAVVQTPNKPANKPANRRRKT